MSSNLRSPVRARSGVATDVPRGCTHLKLRQLGRRLGQHYDAYTAAAGLKTTQYSLLSAVMRLEPIQPAALAASLNLDASTLTRNLRPLIGHGWIELQAGPDARSRRVVSTAAGRTVRLEAQRHWRAAQQDLNRRLGVKTVVALHALLDDVLTQLATDPPDQADRGTSHAAPAHSKSKQKERSR
ncbi:MAG: MarR family winged helix-turn-helix transcriptional regulator [Burkholderiaceae bacterium]